MPISKATTVYDQQGKPINATFQVEVSDGKTSVIIRSRGGTKGSANEQNTEYNLGVELILSRLKAKGCKLVDAVLDTKYTKSQGLSHDERRLNVGKYPIALSSQNLSKLTKGLCDAQRGIRKPGAKGLGNNTKRMRLFVEGMPSDVEKIAAILSGRVEAAGNTLSVLNGITSEHIKQAVVEYAIHQIDHPYKDSTDYDVVVDDHPAGPEQREEILVVLLVQGVEAVDIGEIDAPEAPGLAREGGEPLRGVREAEVDAVAPPRRGPCAAGDRGVVGGDVEGDEPPLLGHPREDRQG